MKISWRTRIALAEQRGFFNNADYRDASSWPDCACGEQNLFIPRKPDGEPLDPELRELGVTFALAVKDNDFSGARTALEAVEARAQIVIAANHARDAVEVEEDRPLGDVWTCRKCGTETSISLNNCQKCQQANPNL